MAISVTHVIGGLAIEHGGPSYSVPALSAALANAGVLSRVRYVGTAGPQASNVAASVPPIAHQGDLGPARLMRGSRSLLAGLHDDAEAGAILHVHGLWLLPNAYPARIKGSRPATPVIHAPRGMLGLAALQISKWRKRIVWSMWQRGALEAADCIHATAMSEYEEIRSTGLRNPVAIVPNGIDISDRLLETVPLARPQQRTILSLGRLHPKKALDVLVRAWASLEPRYPSWRVRIVGPAEVGYDDELRRLAYALGISRLTVEGPLFGDAKSEAYRAADLFVLPTLNENFGLVVAEALAAGVPVICSTGAPWSGLVTERCGWWIDQGPGPLAEALAAALSMSPEERTQMGMRGRDWMLRDFAWSRIAADMKDVYAWLQHKTGRPPCVHID